tara:strand:+ start:1681 stop:1893 length:213 start_codon:yes stop_codon:yes gene_type:complete
MRQSMTTHQPKDQQMTYSDSAKGVTITRARALRELEAHGLTSPADVAQFFADMGYAATYAAHKVLRWLGY